MLLIYVVYITLIFVSLLLISYFSQLTTVTILSQNIIYDISSGVLLVILKNMLVLMFIIFSAFYIYSGDIFFGHLVINNFTYHMFIFTIFLSIFVNYIISLNFSKRIKFLLLNVVINMLLSLLISCLWMVNNIFSIIFILDACNLLILMLLVSDMKSGYIDDFSTESRLANISVFFWISFLATFLLFISGIYLLSYLITSDLNMMFIISSFLETFSYTGGAALQFGYFLLFSCLLLKSGVCPFFIWKRNVFDSMSLDSLFSYMFLYFVNIFLYTVYLLVSFSQISVLSICTLLFILAVLTIIVLIPIIESGITVGDFFVLSTLFNSMFVLLVVLSISL